MTLASKITLVRVAMIPAFMVTMYLSGGTPGLWMYISLTIFIVASLTDSLDGYIARHYNQVTDFGKFLDPLADPGICRNGTAADRCPEGARDRRRMERQSQDRQHHGGALRHDGAARCGCAQLGRYRRHCPHHGLLRRGIFYPELEMPVELKNEALSSRCGGLTAFL